MIFKTTIFTSLLLSSLFSNNLNNQTLKVKYIDDDDIKQTVTITRVHNKICKEVDGTNPDVIWGEDYASSSVDDSCKKTFVTTVGKKITPVSLDKDIKTYGELETIQFIKEAQTNKNFLLVDSRLSDWYFKSTIPSAINIPFTHFNPAQQPDEFEDILYLTGVVVKNGKYDFKNAKSLLLFCNGIWCPQSTWAINNLIKIGYPKDKLFWYRGGMYSWKSVNFTTVKP